MADFASGIYTAVKNYANRPTRSVREIHIVHQDWEVIKSISECVGEKVALDKSMVENNPRAMSQTATTGQADPCTICLDAKKIPKSLPCAHTFCTWCIDHWLSTSSTCPICKNIQGVLTGKQPSDGQMQMWHSLNVVAGNEEGGCLNIKYNFPAGTQRVSTSLGAEDCMCMHISMSK